jgi:hypothetical protein
MSAAQLRIKHFEDNTAGLVLWSPDNRLLLVGAREPLSRIREAADEFVRHCGLRQLYRIRQTDAGWLVELHSLDARRIGWSMPQSSQAAASALLEVAIRHGPWAELPAKTPSNAT